MPCLGSEPIAIKQGNNKLLSNYNLKVMQFVCLIRNTEFGIQGLLVIEDSIELKWFFNNCLYENFMFGGTQHYIIIFIESNLSWTWLRMSKIRAMISSDLRLNPLSFTLQKIHFDLPDFVRITVNTLNNNALSIYGSFSLLNLSSYKLRSPYVVRTTSTVNRYLVFIDCFIP